MFDNRWVVPYNPYLIKDLKEQGQKEDSVESRINHEEMQDNRDVDSMNTDMGKNIEGVQDDVTRVDSERTFMRIIHHNCQHMYAVCQAAFQAGIETSAELVCIQEPYVGAGGMTYPVYNIRWSSVGNPGCQQVAVGIKKDLDGQIVVENRSDLFDHPYLIVLDVWELGKKSEKEQLIERRTIIVDDFNAHSPLWNSFCMRRARDWKFTRPKATPGLSIIDLTLTTRAIGQVASWTIDPEFSTPSDHQFIAFELENLNGTVGSIGPSKHITEWDIKGMNEDNIKQAEKDWQELAKDRPVANENRTSLELDEEAEWIEKSLKSVLDMNAKKLRVCARSKRWWTAEVSEKRAIYKECRRRFQAQNTTVEELRDPYEVSMTPALKDSAGTLAVTIEEKQFTLSCHSGRQLPQVGYSRPSAESSIRTLSEEISWARPAKFPSSTVTLVLGSKQGSIPDQVLYTGGISPSRMKRAKSYRVISPLNFLGKVTEKLVAKLLSDWCERENGLHEGQMGSKKYRSSVDAVARVVKRTQEAWARGNKAGLLLMDVKGAFDHVSKIVSCDTWKRKERLQPVIDGHTGNNRPIQTGVPQGSPVSPILFVIYLSGFFSAVENQVPGIVATSFADDCGFMVETGSIPKVVIELHEAGNAAADWGESNFLAFDLWKDEAILFDKTLRRRRKSCQRMAAAVINLRNHEVRFNKDAIRWLGIWLDSALSFREHKNVYLQKAKKAEARLRSLVGKQGLAPGLIRKVQIAAVQAIAIYGAELWWKDQKSWSSDIQLLINRAQPGEQQENDGAWMQDQQVIYLGQRLANSYNTGSGFSRKNQIPARKDLAMCEARQYKQVRSELSFWSDGSKLVNVGLGDNKEVFDAELYALDLALSIALQGGNVRVRPGLSNADRLLRDVNNVHIWLDSRATISRIQNLRLGPGQWLARRIYFQIRELQKHRIEVHIHWIPGYMEIEGNERADKAAKEAALSSRKCPEEFNSLSHIARTISDRQRIEGRQWLTREHRRRNLVSRSTYKMDLRIRKYDSLKSQHAVTAVYLVRISKQNDDLCEWCGKRKRQTVKHLLLECRKWREERNQMWKKIGDDNGVASNEGGIANLFADRRATPDILQFLERTGVGRRIRDLEEHEERPNRDDELRLAEFDNVSER
ncbi:hypothetical protein EPUL_001602 [Erysiphe pulchra]|uniref:Reverse transcriptase domain-containing protein n=1 Tax=Erysiphe pulchra TaxID=225359 RepID=A0A2S4PYU5_9PEZI|nr:hypothetical protein EPUL_001602 [Erysiphe pulchra]